MQKRRDFLRNTAVMTMGSILLARPSDAFDPSSLPAVGLQLYTLAQVIDDDVAGTLKKVAAIGYTEVESAFSKKSGYYGMTPKEFKMIVDDHGLVWKSHHVSGAPFKGPDQEPLRNLKEDYRELIDEAAEGGLRYLVCAGSPMDTLDAVRTSISTLNKASDACRKVGIKLAYHNHEREFQEVEGAQQAYHLLLVQTDPKHLQMELDIAWATKAGVDPVDLFRKYPGRFPLWHVKDLSADHTTLQPVGEGSIDFGRIFANAKLAGMKHFFVEHDQPTDPFASITTSFNAVSKFLS